MPIKDLITYDIDGTIQINGRSLTADEALKIKENAISLANNGFYKAIKEQMAFEAIKMGIHSSTTMDMLLLSKAILWIQQQEMKWIKDISQDN